MIVKRMAPKRIANRSKMENKTDEATLYLYDEISFWGIDAQEFVKDLQTVNADTIHLRINSPGGDVFAARAIQTALKQHSAKVVAHIDGVAASAASFIAMGADEIEMVEGGFIMIHPATSLFDIFGFFNARSMDKLMAMEAREKELLVKVDESIANDYAKKSGKSVDEVKGWLYPDPDDEMAATWFTAKEALAVGLVDRIYDGDPVENRFDLSIFANVPEKLRLGEDTTPSKRKLERALRDVGLSQSQAKAILAGGLKDEAQREVLPSQSEPAPELQREVAVEVEPKNSEKPIVADRTVALIMKAKKAQLGEV